MESQSDHSIDNTWAGIREEVEVEVSREPVLASFLHATVLNHDRLEDALSFHLAGKLPTSTLPDMLIREIIDKAFADDPSIAESTCQDLCAVRDRDPAANSYMEPFLYFKGFRSNLDSQ